MKRLMISFLLVMVSASWNSLAAPDYAAAQKIIEETAKNLISELQKNKAKLKKDSELASQLATKIVVPRFDFEVMSKRVLGRHWKSASEEQRGKFIVQFQRLLVGTYATSMAEFSDEKVVMKEYVKSKRRENEVTIKTVIEQAGGKGIPIDYKMRLIDNTWKVIDVKIEEVSLVINYRSTFSRDISRIGMDGLIGKLSEKNSKKGGGAG